MLGTRKDLLEKKWGMARQEMGGDLLMYSATSRNVREHLNFMHAIVSSLQGNLHCWDLPGVMILDVLEQSCYEGEGAGGRFLSFYRDFMVAITILVEPFTNINELTLSVE